jgi:hypothetical protein
MKDQVKDVEDKGKAELERYFHLSQKKKVNHVNSL